MVWSKNGILTCFFFFVVVLFVVVDKQNIFQINNSDLDNDQATLYIKTDALYKRGKIYTEAPLWLSPSVGSPARAALESLKPKR